MGKSNGRSNDSALILAEALCARLCHDLSGPLGTLAGALEIAAETGEVETGDGAALDLAGEAASQMKARLRLYRAAWGGGSGAMTGTEIAGLVAPVAEPRRIRTEMDGIRGVLDGDTARLALGLLLLGFDALPRGGALALSGQSGESLVMHVDGPRAAWPDGVIAAFADGELPPPSPRGITLSLLALAAQSCGARLSLAFAAEGEAAPPVVASWD